MGLFDLFSSDSAREAAAAKAAGLKRGYRQASDLFGQGRGAITDFYGQAAQPFEQLYATGQKGYDAYADATGANGAEGLARARNLFTQTPGYLEGLNLSLDSLARIGNAKGAATGNMIGDATKLATNYANNAYGDYVSRLSPMLGAGTSAAAGLAGVKTGQGSALNQSYTGQGGLAFNSEAGIGQANADAAMADYMTSANMWNALMGIGNLGAKLWGTK